MFNKNASFQLIRHDDRGHEPNALPFAREQT